MMQPVALLAPETMIRTVTAVLMAALMAAPLLAEEPAPSQAPSENAPATHSPLVAAAKKAKPKRKRTGAMKITQSDLRKSESALTLPAGKVAPPVTTTAVPPVKLSEVESHEKKKSEEEAASDRTSKAVAEVDSLERELARLEDDYYKENDAGYRDEVILKRFEQTRRLLDEARGRLREARTLSPSGAGPAPVSSQTEPVADKPNG